MSIHCVDVIYFTIVHLLYYVDGVHVMICIVNYFIVDVVLLFIYCIM